MGCRDATLSRLGLMLLGVTILVGLGVLCVSSRGERAPFLETRGSIWVLEHAL